MTAPGLDEELLEDDPEPEGRSGSPGSGAAAPPAGPSRRGWLLFLGLALAVVAADQASKAWITGTLAVGQGFEVLGDWLRIVHWRNSGILFGMLPRSAPAFAVVSLVVAALIVVYHARAARGILVSLALGLLLGGALGNLLDRLRYGSVVDFVDMGIGEWRFYTYNVADASITGAILLLIAMAVLPRLAEWGARG